MIKKKLHGDNLKAQLLAAAEDRQYRFLLSGGKIRGVIVNGTKMVNEMRHNHELGILETLVLGHAYLAAILVAADLKSDERIKIQIECSGPVRGLSVEANVFGEVRGYLHQVPIPIDRPPESFNLSPYFGAGFLTVTKYLEDAKQPFTGRVMLQHGSIAKDMAHYFLTSEQLPTSFHLSVQFDTGGRVAGAGGMFLQVLPGVGDAVIDRLENLAQAFPSIGAELQAGRQPPDLIRDRFQSLKPRILGDKRIEFMCHCNADRMRTYMKMLPDNDLLDMRDHGPFPLELRCHYCNTAYVFSKEDVAAICRQKVGGAVSSAE